MTGIDETGYPPCPADATSADLQRYAAIRLIAETFRNDALSLRLPPSPPADRWERATRAYDEEIALRGLLDSARTLERRFAADQFPSEPQELARARENIDAARAACHAGHPAGCSYSAPGSGRGAWRIVQGCPQDHGEVCQLRLVCLGARAEATFGLEETWCATACRPCATAWTAAYPVWRYAREGL